MIYFRNSQQPKENDIEGNIADKKGDGMDVDGGDGKTRAGDAEDDAHILQSLFEMTGIQSALKHDQIMDAARPESVIMEKEGIFESF